MNKEKKEVTVVIPTIGEESLPKVIKALNNGSLIPEKILVCIPKEIQNISKINLDQFSNVEIVAVDGKGQVLQRFIGFSKSKTKYTLQLDSDMIVDKNLILELMKRIENNSDVAVAPLIIDADTKKHQSFLSLRYSKFNSFELKTLYWVANGGDGFKQGIISRSAINFGLDDLVDDIFVEWIPGGCILHRTDNLILENFYPFHGKAYAEDLFHSLLLSRNGIRLLIANSAFVRIKFIKFKKTEILSFLKEQFFYTRAMLLFIRQNGKSRLRYFLFRFLFLLFSLRVKLFKR